MFSDINISQGNVATTLRCKMWKCFSALFYM